MILAKLNRKGLIHPPPFLIDNTIYLTMMGSIAYGVSTDESDVDVYGITMPPLTTIFPHLDGEIVGFGQQKQRFEQWQEHNVKTEDGGKVYDFSVYSIVKFFNLVMANNMNVLDSIFTPQRCVIHSTQIGNLIRENRRLFLHKGSFYTAKGYAYSQLHKMKTKEPEGKRKATVDKYGFDLKFGYHLVRLLNEAEQILVEHDLDLEKNNEQLKSIRRGEWTMEQIENYFNSKERDLESLYTSSTLRDRPDEKAIKRLLLQCLEHHYGNLERIIKKENSIQNLISEVDDVLKKYR